MPGAGTDKTKNWVQQPGPIVILVEPQLGENIGSAEHHAARFRLGKRLANAAGMAANQVKLQLTNILDPDMGVTQLAEAGVNAIDRGFACGENLNHGMSLIH